jgi:Xaa-Pro aminopeptidase
MMAICARRHGLYASLTRYVFFDRPQLSQRRNFEDVATIEAVALNASRPGTTLAQPASKEVIENSTAVAWNPSLVGAKMEDTVLCTNQGLEILTTDPNWPAIEVEGRKRPDVWVRP